MDVFACLGDVLPPLENHKPAHLPMIHASQAQMEAVRAALGAVDNQEAKAYEKAVAWAIEEKAKQTGYTGPQKGKISFKG